MASSSTPFARPASFAAPRVAHADHVAITSNFIRVATPPKQRDTGRASVASQVVIRFRFDTLP